VDGLERDTQRYRRVLVKLGKRHDTVGLRIDRGDAERARGTENVTPG
jgi:hypothetical protein